MERFARIGRLPSHPIADQVQEVADDSHGPKQEKPRQGLLVQALNESHQTAFCAKGTLPASPADRHLCYAYKMAYIEYARKVTTAIFIP